MKCNVVTFPAPAGLPFEGGRDIALALLADMIDSLDKSRKVIEQLTDEDLFRLHGNFAGADGWRVFSELIELSVEEIQRRDLTKPDILISTESE